MVFCNCFIRCRCALAALIFSVIAGIVAAFLHITGVFTATVTVLSVSFGIAVAYLAVVLIAAVLARRAELCQCACTALNAALIGAVGTITLALILLAAGIVATSIFSAIGVGILVFFFFLMITGTACLVRKLAGCGQ